MTEQLFTIKKSTIAGHREQILGLMSFYLGVILFGRYECQPAQRADELTVFPMPFNCSLFCGSSCYCYQCLWIQVYIDRVLSFNF